MESLGAESQPQTRPAFTGIEIEKKSVHGSFGGSGSADNRVHWDRRGQCQLVRSNSKKSGRVRGSGFDNQ